MKLIMFIISLSLFSIIAWQCNEQPNPPDKPPPTEPDSTSHDFTWQSISFGDAQSYFQDILAISDTDVWAVGHVFLRDSTGQIDIANPYNAVHWDGKEWKLVRIPVKLNYGGGQIVRTEKEPLTSIVKRMQKQAVVISRAGGISIVTDLVVDELVPPYLQGPGPSARMYATNDTVYFVSSSGIIRFWDGTYFKPMQSGTTIDLYDISGKYDGKIYACGGEFNGIVLAYDGVQWSAIDSLSDNGVIARWTVFATNGFFAVGGDDVRYIDTAYSKTLTKPPKEVLEGALKNGLPIGTICIRGSSRKNVFAVGSWQYVIHYNGKTWKWYDELWDETGHTQYAVSATNNSVFIAGYKNGRATILIGRRK